MTQVSWASTALVMFEVSMVLGSCSVLALQAQMVIPLCLLLGGAHSRQEFKRRGWLLWTDLGGAVGTLCSKTEALGSRWKPWSFNDPRQASTL